MQAIRKPLPAPMQTETVHQPFERAPLHAAVLSDRPARLMAALALQGIGAMDAADCDLALLLRDAPDMLVIDLDPDQIPARRIALLVAQLCWLRRDLVVAVSRRCAPRARGFAIDVIFDAEADPETLTRGLHEAARLLCHSRLRPVEAAAPRHAVLHHKAPQRVRLFG